MQLTTSRTFSLNFNSHSKCNDLKASRWARSCCMWGEGPSMLVTLTEKVSQDIRPGGPGNTGTNTIKARDSSSYACSQVNNDICRKVFMHECRNNHAHARSS